MKLISGQHLVLQGKPIFLTRSKQWGQQKKQDK